MGRHRMRSGSCPRQQTPPPEPSCSMWRAILTLLPIAPALIPLPAIAFASPPDPSWVAGIYDGADGDDIVSLVYETSAASAAVPSQVGPLSCLSEISFEGIVRNVPRGHFTRGPRAPPALCFPEFVRFFNSLPPPASDAETSVSLPSTTKLRVSGPELQKEFVVATRALTRRRLPQVGGGPRRRRHPEGHNRIPGAIVC